MIIVFPTAKVHTGLLYFSKQARFGVFGFHLFCFGIVQNLINYVWTKILPLLYVERLVLLTFISNQTFLRPLSVLK